MSVYRRFFTPYPYQTIASVRSLYGGSDYQNLADAFHDGLITADEMRDAFEWMEEVYGGL